MKRLTRDEAKKLFQRDPRCVPRRPRADPEAEAQKAAVEFLEYAAPDLLFYACPNGGLSKGQNGRNKAMGAKAGVFDLHFVLDGGRIAYIEMKAPKDGKRRAGALSDEQRVFGAICDLRGIPWAVCHSAEEVEATLRSWGVVLKATLGGRRAA